VRRCIEDCQRVGIFQPDDPILITAQCDLPYAYVVYGHGRAQAVARIREWLAERDILLAGRYSEWEYYNSDHAFIAGQRAAENARSLLDARPKPAEPRRERVVRRPKEAVRQVADG